MASLIPLVTLLILTSSPAVLGHDILLHRIELQGPGIFPEKFPTPVRYFFVYLRGRNYTGSEFSGAEHVEVSYKAAQWKERCHVGINVFNRLDSSLIVRYKIHSQCRDLKLHVLFKGKDVPGSPITSKGPLLPDGCECPEPNLEKWLGNLECSKHRPHVLSDLDKFGSVDFRAYDSLLKDKFLNSRSSSICHYAIKSNKVYRTCYGEHVGFKVFVDDIFLWLSRKVRLPDVELLTNLGDWPLSHISDDQPFPMFSWCGTSQHRDMLMPTYEITSSTLESMGKVSVDMISLQGSISNRWNEKEEKAFWRGRDSNRERLRLIELAKEHPHLFNASLTNFFFYKSESDKYGPKSPHISFFKFFDYKYQLNIDGTVAAYRFPFLLAGNSVVFKQDSPYFEHFYSQLTPMVHYIPFKRDLSDLVEKIEWAQAHDREAHQIAKNGRQFAEQHLMPLDIICYHVVLLQEWSKKLKSEVLVQKEMEHVPQPKGSNCKCPPSPKDEL